MNDAVVTFDGVWKKFRRGERHDSLRDLIPSLVTRMVRGDRADQLSAKEFWAVQDVSFAVNRGDTLGIMGPNGAGKSTILKLLTRILKPTRGCCQVRGRVGALIELAAGFHPDLTGRENISMQGAVMGMRQAEIAKKFDDIVDFAGVAAFIDTPVKRYSSGMHARLGFSIAAHLNPDVLIIDEILSVGDVAFQQRCLARMMEFKRQGVAIVFVSHNLQAIAAHFDRGLLLEEGRAAFIGTAGEAVACYTARRSRSFQDGAGLRSRKARIVSARLQGADGRPVSEAVPGEELHLTVAYEYDDDRPEALIFGFYVTDAVSGLRLYNAHAKDLGMTWRPEPGHHTVTIDFQFTAHLLKGSYHVNCYISDVINHQSLHQVEPAALLLVRETFSAQGYADLSVRCRPLETAVHDYRAESVAV